MVLLDKLRELLLSRKTWLTIAAIIVAVVHEDYARALDALLLLVGAQGAIDVAAKLRTPTAVQILPGGAEVRTPVSPALAKALDDQMKAQTAARAGA